MWHRGDQLAQRAGHPLYKPGPLQVTFADCVLGLSPGFVGKGKGKYVTIK